MHMEQIKPDEVCVCGHTQFDHEVFHVDVTEVEIGECEPMCECEEYKKREHFVFKTQAVVYWETDADGNVVKVTVVPASRSPHYISHGLSFVEVDGEVRDVELNADDGWWDRACSAREKAMAKNWRCDALTNLPNNVVWEG